MKTKFLPIISAVFMAGLLFSGFVLLDQSKKSKKTISPVLSEKNELLGNTVKSRDLPKELQTFDSPKDAFAEVKNILSQKTGDYALYVKDLTTGDTYLINEDKKFYGASLYKVPVAIATYREIEKGNISLDQVIEYKEVDAAHGSGVISNSAVGTNYTIEELLGYLLKDSDNVAQNMLLRIIGRNAVAGAFVEETKQGIFPIKINTSPTEMGVLLENTFYSRYLKKESTAIMLDTMSNTSFDDRIHSGLSSDIVFSHKIGNWPTRGTWHDCGIASKDKAIIVCVMSENTTYEDFKLVTEKVGLLVSTILD